MLMHRPARRRVAALIALALALFAALPCAAIAESDTCCGANAKCDDASAAPCTQLAATPCCEAEGQPVEASTSAAKLREAPAVPAFRFLLPALALRVPAHTPPPLRSAELTLRSAVLRL